MSRRAGASMIELLASLLMTLVLAGVLFTVFTNTYASRDFVVGQSDAETKARQPLDTLADHVRNAQQYKFAAGESVMSYKVIKAGTINSIEYYASNSDTDTVRYFLDGTSLRRTVGGSTVTVMRDVTSLELRYFKSPTTSGTYNSATLTPCTNVNSPSSSELPLLAMVHVRARVLIDGFERELTTTVRLRNSPRKIRL